MRIDLGYAGALVDEAELHLADRQPDPALRTAQRAAGILDRGGVLPEHPQARWADPARDRHGDLLRRAHHTIAETALRIGELSTAQHSRPPRPPSPPTRSTKSPAGC